MKQVFNKILSIRHMLFIIYLVVRLFYTQNNIYYLTISVFIILFWGEISYELLSTLEEEDDKESID